MADSGNIPCILIGQMQIAEGNEMPSSNSPLSQALAKADREFRHSAIEAERDETTRPVAMSVILNFARESESTERIFLQAPGPGGMQMDDEMELPRPTSPSFR